MICWSCEREAGGDPTCAACGALQPPDAAADHFAVLGVPPSYAQELGALEARYKDLSRKLHPDRFAKADPRARRASLERTMQLNHSWKTLRDPVRRAEYLLERAGVKIEADHATPALLMEILELREELGDARHAGDHGKVERMAQAMRGRAADAGASIAGALEAGTAAGLELAARALVELRYYRRFLDEVEAHEESRAESGVEVGSAEASVAAVGRLAEGSDRGR